MKVRLCPYCDQEMKKAHRCDACKSFVWKANEVDVHYNSGNRRWDEESCAYDLKHDPLHNGVEMPKYTTSTVKTSAERVKPKINTTYSRGRFRARFSLIIIILVIIYSFFQAISGSVGNNNFNYGVEEVWPETAPAYVVEDDWSDNDSEYAVENEFELVYNEMLESDIQSYTDACDHYVHMDTTAEAVNNAIIKFLDSKGLDSYCERYFSGYTNSSAYYFEEFYEYIYNYAPLEDYDSYIQVSSDAVTNEIHNIQIALTDMELCKEITKIIVQECLGNYDVTEEEYNSFFDLDDEDDNNYLSFGVNEVNVYYSESPQCWRITMTQSKYPYNFESAVLESIELSDLEVEQLGLPCNTVNHMVGFYGEKTAAQLENWLMENGISGLNLETYSYNTQTTYPQSGGNVWYEYDFHKCWQWYSEDGTLDFDFNIESDTCTDELHSISLDGIDDSQIPIFIELLIELLDLDVDADAITAQAIKEFDDFGFLNIFVEEYVISIAEYDNGISIQANLY